MRPRSVVFPALSSPRNRIFPCFVESPRYLRVDVNQSNQPIVSLGSCVFSYFLGGDVDKCIAKDGGIGG